MEESNKIPFRYGYRGRVVNSNSPGRIESLFTAGYRPVILYANQIDVGRGVVRLKTWDLGGRDVGLAMEIADESVDAQAAIKFMIIEMNSPTGAEGFGYTGISHLKEHIKWRVERIIKERLDSFLRTNSMWFFIRSKFSQHFKSMRSHFGKSIDTDNNT